MAIDFGRRACSLDWSTCIQLAITGSSDQALYAIGALDPRCERDEYFACYDAGVARAAQSMAPESLVEVDAFYRRACEGGVPEACADHGFGLVYGVAGVTDQAQGVALLQGACDEGLVRACNALGGILARGAPELRDVERALQLYDFSCSLDSDIGCDRGSELREIHQ